MNKFPFNKENDKNLIWEEVKTEHIIKNEWIDFRQSAFRFPDGTEFEPYYSYSRRDYVVIVPFDEDGNLICVRQYRQGIRQVTTEFPAGGIERSDGKEYRDFSQNGDNINCSKAEEALEAARRELTEETGYESDDWTHLITIPSNATIADNYAYVFMAKGCKKVSGQQLDDTEFLNVYSIKPEEIDELIKSGEFQQAVHVMAWLMALRALGQK
ncbi:MULTISPECIES: NUDIX hydrolase [unclassified Butyrivibrio]|uniref:NUDIX hydrolase n=1 Tax=unclassified Butyrivibrio TaxID=2639466 RepID=UPI0003B6AB23|nr:MULTISPECIES: NUDIX hydrolase [unclassified Butyrivibrio]